MHLSQEIKIKNKNLQLLKVYNRERERESSAPEDVYNTCRRNVEDDTTSYMVQLQ